MFVVLIDRLRQRVMTAVRILFLLALVAVLTSQLWGLFRTSLALRSGQGLQVSNPSQSQRAGGIIDTLTRDLQHFYQGR
ncbi:MAG TPA: hypothetical protein VMW83_06560 [Spirochaetia bacterium]|nr:hypothetical protein [Spirochaetia bacterium]